MGQYPSANDKQIVNIALVCFLNAVTMHFISNADWTFERKAFQIGNIFEARVDGFRHLPDDKILAILEANPCVRTRQSTNIRIQESAPGGCVDQSAPR